MVKLHGHWSTDFYVAASNVEHSCGYEKLEKMLSCMYYIDNSDIKDF